MSMQAIEKLIKSKKMKIGLYDPYLDTLGGGERYIMTFASCLSKKHRVELFWNDASILKKAQDKFNLDLSDVKTTANIFVPQTSLSKRFLAARQYDAIIFMSDGSIPYLFSKKNILLFQFPVNWVNGKSLHNKIKLRQMHAIICYTDFVKHYLDKTFSVSSRVIFPPVEQVGFDKNEKENIILTVGRFTKAMNAKKQEVLVNAFKDMCKKGLKDWQLVLAGSYLPEDKDFLESIEKSAHGYPITIAANVSFGELIDFYKKAKIYWHAAGYGEDLEKHPERAEHFGITTVEGMSAGAVPVVINGGGQKEIVTDGKNGFLWNTIDELLGKTQMMMTDNAHWEKLSHEAIVRARDFRVENFCQAVSALIEK